MAQSTIRGRGILLCLACALLAGPLAYGDAAMTPWCGVVDTALVGWNISRNHSKTHKLCRVACLDTPGCESANYWGQDKICEMNSVSHFNVSVCHLVHETGSIYTFTAKMGCLRQSVPTDILSCRRNTPRDACSDKDDNEGPGWHLVFKGVAGTGVKLHEMWTTTDWNTSLEASGSCRNDSLHRAWRDGQLNIKRVKFSLHDDTGVRAELIFNGAGSDIKNWFSKDRLISSPWQDLKQTATLHHYYFSVDGDAVNERRFFINKNYGGCHVDYGWLVVSESATTCEWDASTAAYPIILYSTTNSGVAWQNVLAADATVAGTVGRADYLTIHVDTE